MSYRFFRRLRIAPGLTVNLSKSGPSLSVGGRGGHVTFGGARGRRTTIGLPGTGLYWTTVHAQGRPRGHGSDVPSRAVRGQHVRTAPQGSPPLIGESPSA